MTKIWIYRTSIEGPESRTEKQSGASFMWSQAVGKIFLNCRAQNSSLAPLNNPKWALNYGMVFNLNFQNGGASFRDVMIQKCMHWAVCFTLLCLAPVAQPVAKTLPTPWCCLPQPSLSRLPPRLTAEYKRMYDVSVVLSSFWCVSGTPEGRQLQKWTKSK